MGALRLKFLWGGLRLGCCTCWLPIRTPPSSASCHSGSGQTLNPEPSHVTLSQKPTPACCPCRGAPRAAPCCHARGTSPRREARGRCRLVTVLSNLCTLLCRVSFTGDAAGPHTPAGRPCRERSPCACCPAGGVPLAEKPGGAAWVTPSSNPKAGTPLQDAFNQSEVGAVGFGSRAMRERGLLALKFRVQGRRCKHPRPSCCQVGSRCPQLARVT